MKQFLFLVRFYLTFLLLFVLAKPCFVLVQSAEVRGGTTFTDVFRAIYHGLSLDLATTAYVSATVWLLTGLTLWIRVWRVKTIYKVYAAFAAFTFSLIVVADCCLYDFWRFKIDGTVFHYLDNPKGVLDNVSHLYLVTATCLTGVLTYVVYRLLTLRMPYHLVPTNHRSFWSTLWIVLGGMLFVSIRGGVDKSCTNVGQVYFSHRQFLNHTAVNPCFSLLSSLPKLREFDDKFNFLQEDECRTVFRQLGYNTESQADSSLLTVSRPNILLVLLENCGGTFVHAVDSLADTQIMPNLNQLANEGIVFSGCYANGDRTDQGLVSSLSGYPAFPDVSVTKMPFVCHHLPSLARTLLKAGYTTEFMYAGDLNHRNARGYLMATGYEKTYSQKDFPFDLRQTHERGVTDHIMFDSLYTRLLRLPQDRPWHMGVQTLSSQSPWQVPYRRIPNDPTANAIAYLDASIGRFVRRLKKTSVWKNTLIIFAGNHGTAYPADLSRTDERRSHIPVIWCGGAVRQGLRISELCNQSDLAATLLGQLELPHNDFYFSRDVLSRTYTRPSAVHVWSEGLYYKDSTGISVLNLEPSPTTLYRESPAPSPFRVKAAQAILQTNYDHL